jgi:hypothetical protein
LGLPIPPIPTLHGIGRRTQNRSSRKVNAFSRFGENSFYNACLSERNRRTRASFNQRCLGPAPPIEQPVHLLHDLTADTQLRQAACDSHQRLPFGRAELALHKHRAMIDRSLIFCSIRFSRRVVRRACFELGQPRRSLGFRAANSLKEIAPGNSGSSTIMDRWSLLGCDPGVAELG